MSLRKRLSQPGIVLSALVHAGALAATLVAFSTPEKLDDQQETVPVEVVTANQFNQIMKGDKSAKEVRPNATAAAEQVASAAAEPPPPPPPPPTPATPEPAQDTPPPPPPPPQAEEPPPPPVPEPPPRPTPPPPAPPVPTPPVRDVTAEPVVPKPVPKPVVKPPPVPLPPVVPHPAPPKVHETHVPPPPKHVDKPKPDQLAKLLETQPDPPPPKPAPKPSIRKAVTPAPAPPTPAPQPAQESNHFDLTDITKLLTGHDSQPQKPASSGSLSHLASLGSPTASAAKMSPSFWAGLDGVLEDQYRTCWSYLGLATGAKYIPQVRVVYGLDGSLQGQPVLVNPPSDPAMQNLADSALRAVRRCNPLKIPEQYAPYYEQWKGRVLRFDPEEMAG